MFLLCPKGGRKGTSCFFSDLGPPRRLFGNPNIVGTFACPSLLSNGLWRFKRESTMWLAGRRTSSSPTPANVDRTDTVPANITDALTISRYVDNQLMC